MRRRMAPFLVACLVASGPTRAEFYTGNDLKPMLEQWEQGTNSVDSWIGAGYVLGVHDVLSGITICSGADVPARDLIKTALQYMRENPEVLNLTADRSVASSLKALWPCAKDSGFAKYWRGRNIEAALREVDTGNTQNSKDDALTLGYLTGVFDAVSGVVLCAPTTVTNGQLASITLKTMRDNPDMRELFADVVVLKALMPLWPCKTPASTAAQPANPVHKQPPKPKPSPQTDSPF